MNGITESVGYVQGGPWLSPSSWYSVGGPPLFHVAIQIGRRRKNKVMHKPWDRNCASCGRHEFGLVSFGRLYVFNLQFQVG